MHRPISRKTTLAGLAAAGVLGLGIAAPAMAFASDGSPAPSGSSSPAARSTASPSTAQGQRGEGFAAALAKELGVSQDKVTAALQQLRDQHRADHKPDAGTKTDRTAQLKQRLDQAVKDGKLTQAEADAVTKAIDAGVLPGRGWWGGQWQHRTGGPQGQSGGSDQRGSAQDRSGRWAGHGQWRDHGQRRDADRSGFAAALAKELGVSQDKVTAALQKLRDQHRADHKPDAGTKTDRTAQLKQRLDQAVKDGKLTQAEADAVTKAVQTLAAQWQHARTK